MGSTLSNKLNSIPAFRCILLVVLVCVLFLPGSTIKADSELPPRYYALVVGVKQYDPNELRPLPYAEPDATELSKVLKNKGFRRVVLMTQTEGAKQFRYLPTSKNIRTTLEGLLKNKRKQDVVLVALAGHGVQFRGENSAYFCPMDTKLKKRETLISLKEIYQQLEGCNAGTRLLLVDACRNDPQSDNSRSANEVKIESVTRPQTIKPPGGVAALFSCSSGQRAYESEKLKHGLFFHSIIEGLNGKADFRKSDPLTWSELVAWTKGEVPDLLADIYGDNVEQFPELVGSIRGRILVFPGPASRQALNDEKKQFTNSIGMELVKIPAGEFTMGFNLNLSDDPSDKLLSDRHPHPVHISQSFYMAKTEVTQQQWKAMMGTKPWMDGTYVKEGSNYPASNMSWGDAIRYCRKLSQKEGKTYRLPTEAEWEYACRAGSTTMYNFGDDASRLGDYAWYDKNANDVGERYAHKVAQKRANRFGLYDMNGNVREWCQDWYGEDYYEKSPYDDPSGPSGPSIIGLSRVFRGGAWNDSKRENSSSYRFHGFRGDKSGLSGDGIGFRVVCELY
ncbi:SUMF1/EgtB/PvdO family nonheme iron enzyme [Gimesia sp.]|uniref:SUMF1/EgtB/PvdO family nonheme iron enzyme n=1 Tax=Gimesia sp. TaxID=2024833 RepID=UPI003A949830